MDDVSVSTTLIPQEDEVRRKDVEDNKDLAALSYLWVLSVIVFIARGKSPFIRWHAKQGMILFGVSLIVFSIPTVGRLLALLVLVGIIIGFMHAAAGQWKDVPMVGPLSRGDLSSVRQDMRGVVQSLKEFWKHILARMKKASDTPPTPPSHP